jgi:hypothetical protein
MSRIVRLGLWATIASLYVIAVLWTGVLLDVPQALGEYLRPTTEESGYMPQGCILTNETPPPDLMRIVENQKEFYHLTLQKVVVCRSTRRLLGFEQRFVGLPFGDEDLCRPLLKGCCSCQFGRHVVVAAANPTDTGSVLVGASLIQSRWDYLRLKWNRGHRTSWFWCWPLTGALLLAFALSRISR